MTSKELPQMPYYSQSIAIPASLEEHFILYIRYYGPWNEGQRGPVAQGELYWPEVRHVDSNGELISTAQSNIAEASVRAFSNSATVLDYIIVGTAEESEIIIEGFFEQVGYCSFSVYRSGSDGSVLQISHIEGQDFTMVSGENPFIPDNNSVFAYERPMPSSISAREVLRDENIDIAHVLTESQIRMHRNASFGLYKATVEEVSGGDYGLVESISEDGCSPDYLVAFRDTLQELPAENLLMLKMLIPKTFIHSDTPDLIYQGYQLQELTIDSSYYTAIQGYYSVNSRQLNDFKAEDGYVHVFFAPEDTVEMLRVEQGCAEGIPPIYIWQGITGYLLVKGSIIIRYRGSAPDWEGNLNNAPCYLTKESSLPVDSDSLGQYCPILVALD